MRQQYFTIPYLTQSTSCSWPAYTRSGCATSGLHSRAVRSILPVAMLVPRQSVATLHTGYMCPWREASPAPVSLSHNRTVVSSLIKEIIK